MSNTIFIVGGGSSLENYDWSLLREKRVIAVNRAFQVLPTAEAIYFSDIRFFEWFKEGLLSYKGLLITGARIEHSALINYRLTGNKGLETRLGCIRGGNNSLYAAMNVAYHMGAKKLVILGLDMCFSGDNKTHWHSGYKTTNLGRQFTKMVPYFSSIAEPLYDVGVEVLNANMNSEVTCFKKIPLEEAHLED